MVTKGKVLVVDDEINLCRILGAKLSKNGYNVETVHDGLSAVEKVRESDFDVVLLDLILPKLDGLSALTEIRNFNDTLPVIVMTACENYDFESTAQKHGISAFINKPFDLQNVVSLIGSLSNKKNNNNGDATTDPAILFAIGEEVTIQLANSPTFDVINTCVTDRNGNCVELKTPIVDSKPMDIEIGDQVKVNLPSKEAFYSFTSNVVAVKNEKDNCFVLEKPSMIYRIQRRKHKRFESLIPIEYMQGIKWEESKTPKKGLAHNISKGGTCIEVEENILIGDVLSIKLLPKTNDEISAIAEVLRTNKNDNDKYILGCRFETVDTEIENLLKNS
ncbi:MAG: response regulator [Armatimonadota bacterium]